MFDFRNDEKVHNIGDQLLFGPSFMACPVTKPMYYASGSREITGTEKSRQVYLPEGTAWTDFYTGRRFEGGNYIAAPAPISHIPVFVRAGAVIPMGPFLQYSSEKPNAPWEIRIYPGADGEFTVYEDEGDGYGYEKGICSTFTIAWNDRERRLTISDRKGSYPGMTHTRRFDIVIVGEGRGVGIDVTAVADAVVEYDGTKTSLVIPSRSEAASQQ